MAAHVRLVATAGRQRLALPRPAPSSTPLLVVSVALVGVGFALLAWLVFR